MGDSRHPRDGQLWTKIKHCIQIFTQWLLV